MHEPNEMQIRLSELKHQGYLHEAEDARLLARYLRETRDQRSWRFRLAEVLLGWATSLSPHHRTMIQLSRKSSGTILTR